MTVEEAKAYINEARKKGSVLGMESISRLCKRLSNPQNYGKVIHIAGTNGKGSTGRMLEQALLAMGYKVGRYSSPAVFSYEEIIQVNQKNITWEELATLFEEINEVADEATTSFEIETAAAFLYFKQQQCDFSIVEVGMGGVDDATNVIEAPVASVITSISRDHTAFLGNTLSEIAEKKAGIVKETGVVVKLFQTPEINDVITKRVAAVQKNTSNLYFARQEAFPICEMDAMHITVETPWKERVSVGLTGIFQQENLACALTTLLALQDANILDFNGKKEAVYRALEKIVWPGRMEVVKKEPLCIVDGCHNPDAAEKMQKTLQALYKERRIHFVIGVFKDKDYEHIFSKVLPLGVSADCVAPKGPRGLASEKLARVAEGFLETVACHQQVEEAMQAAFNRCKEKEDMVLCFGSLSYLGEVKKYVNGLCESVDSK
ncbi:dihydrofolate synthase / folylpolyglutamate synthase [Lachnospiraceae bacterium XBB1006]|nr:dihydrofolate synthase / folylpolyglutamate synthase [Lachnospiraceae bacterium XBB1006]